MLRHAFTKLGMTSIFTETGEELAVTVLRYQSAKVLRHEKLSNGKTLVVVEYDNKRKKKLLKGWQVDDVSNYEVGSALKHPIYEEGTRVKLTGVSKGRGFQDAMTRHNFHGGPASHGSRFHRAPGSVGMRTEPGRTIKGKKLPGHDGVDQLTLTSVRIAYWSSDENVLAVVGGVPGARGGIVFI